MTPQSRVSTVTTSAKLRMRAAAAAAAASGGAQGRELGVSVPPPTQGGQFVAGCCIVHHTHTCLQVPDTHMLGWPLTAGDKVPFGSPFLQSPEPPTELPVNKKYQVRGLWLQCDWGLSRQRNDTSCTCVLLLFFVQFYPGSGKADNLDANVVNAPIVPLWRERRTSSRKHPRV